jgi:hypothetical protein
MKKAVNTFLRSRPANQHLDVVYVVHPALYDYLEGDTKIGYGYLCVNTITTTSYPDSNSRDKEVIKVDKYYFHTQCTDSGGSSLTMNPYGLFMRCNKLSVDASDFGLIMEIRNTHYGNDTIDANPPMNDSGYDDDDDLYCHEDMDCKQHFDHNGLPSIIPKTLKYSNCYAYSDQEILAQTTNTADIDSCNERVIADGWEWMTIHFINVQ